MRIAVVYGGTSSERNASAENAKYIDGALRECGYETCMIPYEKDLVRTLKEQRTDIVFVCVQGKGHGDGTIQAILEQEGIPFTGSGFHAAAIINDKIVSKLLFERFGIRTPKWRILTGKDYGEGLILPEQIGYPFVAKAPSEGGSFGIALIRNEKELEKVADIFSYDDPILIEEFIEGNFYTVGVIERDGIPVTLPCVRGVELEEGTENDDPKRLKVFTGAYAVREAKLPRQAVAQMEDMARKAFRITGAEDAARIDFMVSEQDGLPYALEINAVPGLKPRSLLPGEAAMAGMSYRELIEGILLSAWKKSERSVHKEC